MYRHYWRVRFCNTEKTENMCANIGQRIILYIWHGADGRKYYIERRRH